MSLNRTNYAKFRQALDNEDKAVSLNDTGFIYAWDKILKIFADKQVPELTQNEKNTYNRLDGIATRYNKLLEELASLHQSIARKKAAEHKGTPQEEQNFLAAADEAYTKAIALTNGLFDKDSSELQVEQFDLVEEIVRRTRQVLDGPSEFSRTNLKESVAKLGYQLETNPAWSGLFNLGRALIGALEMFLGAAFALTSIFTGVGLIATLATGLYTRGKHWGPLTWGVGLFHDGLHRAVHGGPTPAAKAAAKELGVQAGKMEANLPKLTP